MIEKRYNEVACSGTGGDSWVEMVEDKDGRWVWYEDHCAEVESLTKTMLAIREQREKYADELDALRARLLAIELDKEHGAECHYWSGSDCTCGRDAVIAALEQK